MPADEFLASDLLAQPLCRTDLHLAAHTIDPPEFTSPLAPRRTEPHPPRTRERLDPRCLSLRLQRHLSRSALARATEKITTALHRAGRRSSVPAPSILQVRKFSHFAGLQRSTGPLTRSHHPRRPLLLYLPNGRPSCRHRQRSPPPSLLSGLPQLRLFLPSNCRGPYRETQRPPSANGALPFPARLGFHRARRPLGHPRALHEAHPSRKYRSGVSSRHHRSRKPLPRVARVPLLFLPHLQ